LEKIDKNMLKGIFIRRPLKNFIEDAVIVKINNAQMQQEMEIPFIRAKTIRMASNTSHS
jgi:hypothetical protein